MSSFFVAGEKQPPITGRIVLYGEEGSGKTRLAATMSEFWDTPGAKLSDGLLIAWDHGAHDTIRGCGHSMDTLDLRRAVETKGLAETLNNLEKIITPDVVAGRKFAMHSSISALDRLADQLANRKYPEEKDNQAKWGKLAEYLVYYATRVGELMPGMLHIYEFHAKAVFEQKGAREANDKLKKEAEGIMPIMPDGTGKGANIYTKDASLTLYLDVIPGVGREPNRHVGYWKQTGKFKAKSRFSDKLPAVLEGEMLNLRKIVALLA